MEMMHMALCLTIAELDKLRPCRLEGPRVRALLRKLNNDAAHCFTAAEAQAAGCTLDDLVWAASAVARTDPEVERRLRHWIADCAARVLHIYERHYPNDSRPRDAIKAARHFADGKISAAARAAAWDAAWAAAWAARDAARAAAWDAARAAAWAARDAARASAWDAEEQFQFDRLILWLAPVPPKPLRLPARPVIKQAA
jgi:hypothetical protein